MDIDLATAWLRQVSGNAQAALDRFAVLMEASLPQHTLVHRSGGMFRPKVITGMEIDLSPKIFGMKIDRNRLHTLISSKVHGVVLNSRAVDGGDWMRQLMESIGTETEAAQSVADTLKRI